MYNPRQDIVAGRTARQIESAKRRAVKGGGRKRCRKGKSCGATCINGSKVCLVDLPWVSSNGLSRVAQDIQNRPKPSVDSLLKEMEEHYKEIRKLNEASMPDAERDWRVNEFYNKIDSVRSKAEAKIGSGGLESFRRKEEDFRIMSLGDEKIKREVRDSLFKVAASKGALETGNFDSTQRGILREGIEFNLKRAEKYLGFISPGRDKEILTRDLGLQTGKVKPLSIGSLDEVNKAGKSFMDRYKGKLDAAFSIWNRRIAVEERIRDRINNGNLPFREKMRLRKALQSIISRSARANERSFKLMEEIRRELLKTKLSESDIKGILSRLKIEGKNLSSDSALIKQVRSQVEEFARMFNGKGLLEASDRKGFFTASLREISVNTTDRAHAKGNFIMTSGIPRVTFHELGHIVENGRPWLADYAEKWRDGKAFTLRQVESAKGSEVFVKGSDGKIIPHATRELSGRDVPVFRLVDMPVNKNRGYDPQEIAVADKFMDLYMGKVYGWRGSEVISMGIETFSSPQDMRHLYVNHPDLFETVVGLALT